MLKELLKHLLDCRSKDLKLVTDTTVNHMTKKIAIILKNCIFNHTLRSQNECAEFKAMKSSPLLGPFCGSEFWGFSLLKI